MMGYYDVILGLIPVSLIGLTLVLVGAGVSLSLAVPLAASTSAILIGHALFVNSPTQPSGTTNTNSRIRFAD